MEISNFKQEFKQLGGVFITDKVALLREPLELINLTTNAVIASFDNLDDALGFELNGKTLEQRISVWEAIVFPPDRGGRGGSSGFSGDWPSAGGDLGKDDTRYDYPVRMNAKIGAKRTYDDMLKAFISTHAESDKEHGVVVDQYGFAVKYRHGNVGSVSGPTGTKDEIAIHNHPAGGLAHILKGRCS